MNTIADNNSSKSGFFLDMCWIKYSCWVLVIPAMLLLYAMNLWLGDLNQDEGWYLYAAGCVAEGQLPYVDFASTQGPVMTYVYALFYRLIRFAGLAGGRGLTALLGLSATFVAAWMTGVIASRFVSGRSVCRNAALWVLLMLGLNLYHVYFTVIVKTYALTALLLVSAVFCMLGADGRRPLTAGLCAGAFFALAAGTRTSALMGLVAAFFALFFELYVARRGKTAVAGAGYSLVGLCAGAGIMLLIVYGPFVYMAPRGVWFALVEYHAGREAGSLLSVIAYKAGFIARWIRASFVPLLLTAGICLWRMSKAGYIQERVPAVCRLVMNTLWGSVLLISLLHFSAPFPYDDYQVIIMPLLASGSVLLLVQFFGKRLYSISGAANLLSAILFVCVIAAAASSPVAESWFIAGRDRIWWPLKEEFPLSKLRRVGREVAEKCPADQVLLTQDLYLAVEAGRKVPPGLELGPFSYFPDWSTEKAEACRVLNREKMIILLRSTEAPVAAFSGYGLTIACPEVREIPEPEQKKLWGIVLDRYEVYAEEQSFGQAFTRLRLLERKRRAD